MSREKRKNLRDQLFLRFTDESNHLQKMDYSTFLYQVAGSNMGEELKVALDDLDRVPTLEIKESVDEVFFEASSGHENQTERMVQKLKKEFTKALFLHHVEHDLQSVIGSFLRMSSKNKKNSDILSQAFNEWLAERAYLTTFSPRNTVKDILPTFVYDLLLRLDSSPKFLESISQNLDLVISEIALEFPERIPAILSRLPKISNGKFLFPNFFRIALLHAGEEGGKKIANSFESYFEKSYQSKALKASKIVIDELIAEIDWSDQMDPSRSALEVAINSGHFTVFSTPTLWENSSPIAKKVLEMHEQRKRLSETKNLGRTLIKRSRPVSQCREKLSGIIGTVD